ncbi:MAG: hypothetical protein IKW99_03780 [Bacteroidales bacterium]|nr:hypothetical protein [Bacteroidales bacterium]
MENLDNTLLEMREQMRQLKEKLDDQKIVNERIMRKSCTQTINHLRFKSNLPYVFGVLAILLSPYFLQIGMSMSFVIFTDVMMLVCIVATYFTNLHIPRMDADLVTATEELRKYKKIHAEWLKIALPMLAIWVGLAIWDAVRNLQLSGQELYGMIAGLSVGVIVGTLIGLKIRRDQMNAADELLAQLKDLKETD